MFTVQQENATKFGTKIKYFHIFSVSLSDFFWLYYCGFMHDLI